MAASKSKLVLFHLRSVRSLSSLSSTFHLARLSHLPSDSNPPTHHHLPPRLYPLGTACFSFSRSFSSSPDVVSHVTVDDSILPVRALVSLLDGFHDLTGLPWWITIMTSALAMRFALLPVVILPLQKIKTISEFAPRLPPPLPPLFSGRSYIDHILNFRRKRKEIGCPSHLWFFAPFFAQAPCFLLWITSIRRMCLDHHPGFECGGALWFQDLTVTPYTLLCPIFPVMIAGLHFANVQISFKMAKIQEVNSIFDQLLKLWKYYLDFISFSLLVIGFYVPQGSLVYWVTNSSITLVQQILVKHPTVVAKLGLPDPRDPIAGKSIEEIHTSDNLPLEPLSEEGNIIIEELSAEDLFKLSIKRLVEKNPDKAISSLELALEKDPNYLKAMIVLGQVLMQKGMLIDAREHLERAVSELSLAGHPTGVEEVDLWIQSCQSAGIVCARQGMESDALVHLEKLATLQEPEDPRSKAHYYDGLLLLSSALVRANRKEEGEMYLRKIAAYDPSYSYLLEELEKEDDIVDDLAKSRRSDYKY